MESFVQHRGAGQAGESGRATWPGTAFLVEALILLAFLVGALAVFMQLFGASAVRGAENGELAQAIVLASNSAEEFAADPQGAAAETTEDGFTVRCDVQPEKTAAGTLYHASITVESNGDEVYQLETSRYVSEVA